MLIFCLRGFVVDCVNQLSLVAELMTAHANTPPGAGQLSDAIATLIQQGHPIDAWRMQGRTFDCGYIQGWLMANQQLGREAGLLD